MSDGQGADSGAAGATGSGADMTGGAPAGGDQQQQTSAGDAGVGAAADGGGDQQQGAQGGAADPAYQTFLEGFSADPGENSEPSMRDWVQSRGYKSIDEIAKSARDNQKAVRESGRIKVPGEGATPEEISAFNKAIGVPDDVKGYEAPKLVDGDGKPLIGSDGNPVEIDQARFDALASIAHKAGLPKSAFEAVMQEVAQLDLQAAADVERDIQQRAAAHAKKWGADEAANTAAITRAAEALGLNREELLSIRAAIGPERALDVFSKLGKGLSEDVMVKGDGARRFGISPADAQKALDQKKADPAWSSKAMVPGTAENAEYNRYLEALGAEANRQAMESA